MMSRRGTISVFSYNDLLFFSESMMSRVIPGCVAKQISGLLYFPQTISIASLMTALTKSIKNSGVFGGERPAQVLSRSLFVSGITMLTAQQAPEMTSFRSVML